MESNAPPPTREGRLIEDAAKATGRSVRNLAANAGISDTRWRHIVRGWQPTQGGGVAAVRAPALTLARMARAVGVTAEQLAGVERGDAAELLRGLAFEVVPEDGNGPDEIDLIYSSRTMTAEQKLAAIRKVLKLRAQADAEASANTETSARREPTNHT
jgi:hypothetical protein